jgi:phage terminase large subunit
VLTATRATPTPAEQAHALFGHDHWRTPAAVLRALFRPHARVAVKGCHASGKTFAAADAVCLALADGADVLTTAPTGDQVRGQLWQQIRDAVRDSRIPESEWGDVLTTAIYGPDGNWAIGRSTDQGVRFQGYHARPGAYLLIVIDEAPGVEADIFTAIAGIEAGGDVRILMLGNPDTPLGPFYDVFGKALPGWERFTINAFETPNLAGLSVPALLALPEAELARNERPYLVTRRWVRDRHAEWGPDSPLWCSRVLGEFPADADDALIPRAWLLEAERRPLGVETRGAITAGLDVAGPGEAETVLGLRRGRDILHARAWPDQDPRQAVIDELRPWLHRGLARINVDAVGIGWYFYRDLKAAFEEHGVAVEPVDVGKPSGVLNDKGEKRYANLKAEYYWHLREQLGEGEVAGLPPRAREQLEQVRYSQPLGVIAIERKEDLRKRGVPSPDWAEMAMLLFAPEDPAAERMRAFMQIAGRRAPPR